MSQLRYHPRSVRIIKRDDGSVEAICTVEVDGAKSCGFTHEAVWRFHGDGRVEVRNAVKPKDDLPPLPRLGLSLVLAPVLENMKYYGRGPRENYIDRNTGSDIGYWESTVTEQFVEYARP